MKFDKLFKKIFFCLILLLSCEEKKQNESYDSKYDKVCGLYKFEYPSGEIEVIKLSKSFTYQQIIYKNIEDFNNQKNHIIKNKNKWRMQNDEIEFDNWLAYCDLRDPKVILKTPIYTDMKNIYWVEQNGDNNSLLNFFYDTGYFFNKID
jgi:hypothetical protein